jgi:excinuclease ABC subunit A
MEKPDVDLIEGLSPSISIDQKTTSNNPRSTVGTVTEIYDYLRLLYARVGTPYCPEHNEPISSQTVKQMVEQIRASKDEARLQILAPIVKRQKGTHKDLFEKLRKDGYMRVIVDGDMHLLEDEITLEKNKNHDISVVVDRIMNREENRSRMHDSIETALKMTDGLVEVLIDTELVLFSANYACKYCGFSLPRLEPRLFSFNSPLGACDDCKGLGFKQKVSIDLLIPDDTLSIRQGGIRYYKKISIC